MCARQYASLDVPDTSILFSTFTSVHPLFHRLYAYSYSTAVGWRGCDTGMVHVTRRVVSQVSLVRGEVSLDSRAACS